MLSRRRDRERSAVVRLPRLRVAALDLGRIAGRHRGLADRDRRRGRVDEGRVVAARGRDRRRVVRSRPVLVDEDLRRRRSADPLLDDRGRTRAVCVFVIVQVTTPLLRGRRDRERAAVVGLGPRGAARDRRRVPAGTVVSPTVTGRDRVDEGGVGAVAVAVVEASYGAAPLASTKIVAEAGAPTHCLTTRTVESSCLFVIVQVRVAPAAGASTANGPPW